MELQTPLRFHATVLCWTQGSEVQKIEVSRSFAHNNPYLDFLQGANSAMSKNTVRRLRLREDVDVSLANTEAVANVFGLSLAEFVSAPGQKCANGILLPFSTGARQSWVEIPRYGHLFSFSY